MGIIRWDTPPLARQRALLPAILQWVLLIQQVQLRRLTGPKLPMQQKLAKISNVSRQAEARAETEGAKRAEKGGL